MPGLPEPSISAVLSAHRATFDAASPISLGDVSGHVTGDGDLTFRCVGMRGTYEQVAVDGRWTSAGLVADAELTRRSGPVSRATVTLNRR